MTLSFIACTPGGPSEAEEAQSAAASSDDTAPNAQGSTSDDEGSTPTGTTHGEDGTTASADGPADETLAFTTSTTGISMSTTGFATEGLDGTSTAPDGDGSSEEGSEPDLGDPVLAVNPLIWADVPDPSVIRVGDTYYMSSTTMHMNPGLPIMRSTDLARWDIASYAYATLAEGPSFALENGQSEYGSGTWASTIRHHDGVYYVMTFSYSTGNSYIFHTSDVEGGDWSRITIGSVYHDPALFFDDDGRVYVVYGTNDIRIVEFNPDLSGPLSGGINQILIPNSSAVTGATSFYVQSEGAHLQKIEGRYYVSLISWPQGSGRSQLLFRSEDLLGTYEGRVVLSDQGVAQGGFIDTPEGDWYALLFQDRGAVGRIPFLVPVAWNDGWPELGIDGRVPATLDFLTRGQGPFGIVASDEFEQAELELEWQWNHDPDHDHWSLTQRPGYLRLTNARTDPSFTQTRNTLTQRTFGPTCAAYVELDTREMNAGDYAGLGALQAEYGFVGVRSDGATKAIVMVLGDGDGEDTISEVPLLEDIVYLRIDMDYQDQRDDAFFYYSLDGMTWEPIGETLPMIYSLDHFMGYRYGLFNFATQSPGGHADFGFFRVDDTLD